MEWWWRHIARGSGKGTASCTVLSQNGNTVMFIMFSASRTTAAAVGSPLGRHHIFLPLTPQSQQIHTEKDPWALRASPLLPSPWLRPPGCGDAQAPQC